MTFDSENKVKVRIKLRSGEEFEAEGSPEFIEKQRADFLNLIGKEGGKAPKARLPRPVAPELPLESAYAQEPSSFAAPAALRRHTAVPQGHTPPEPFADTPQAAPAAPDENQRLWEEVCKTEEDMVILRRKSRLLSAETAALLLIAASKALLRADNGISALCLSKALSKSGYGGNRLDRVLAGEMKRGTIKSAGSKRSRSYSLSDEGFARAFVLAGKVLEDWR